MEIAMIVAAVILLNLILGCKNKSTKVSKSTPSPMSKGKKSPQTAKLKSIRTGEEETQIATEKKEQTTALATEETQIKQSLEDVTKKKTIEDGNNKSKDREKKKDEKDKKKDDKEKKKDEKEKKNEPAPLLGKGKKTSKRPRATKTKRTQEGPTQEMEEGPPQAVPRKKSPANELPTAAQKADKNGTPMKSGKSVKRVLSNPIVTPVTDEFPTEEEGEKKNKTEIAEPKTAPEKKMQRKVAQVVDYKGKKKKKGKDRNISNPIVTPCTDEFPTEEEKVDLKAKKAAA